MNDYKSLQHLSTHIIKKLVKKKKDIQNTYTIKFGRVILHTNQHDETSESECKSGDGGYHTYNNGL